MKRKYDRALAQALAKQRPTRRIYDLLVAADADGDARATYALATWYLHGSPFTGRNLATAIRMLKQAAAENVADAAFDLAVSFEKGNGVRRSVRRAFELHMQAALLGEQRSFYEVGRMYFYGIGVRRSQRIARLWLKRSRELGIDG